MLLLTLFVLVLLDTQFPNISKRVLTFIAGEGTAEQTTAKGVLYTIILILVVFISYQGETLVYPGGARSPGLSLVAGLLNGYLFAGSVWYYLAQAGWPFLNPAEPFSQFYQAATRVLPPAILSWQYLIALVVIMLVLRVWR